MSRARQVAALSITHAKATLDISSALGSDCLRVEVRSIAFNGSELIEFSNIFKKLNSILTVFNNFVLIQFKFVTIPKIVLALWSNFFAIE